MSEKMADTNGSGGMSHWILTVGIPAVVGTLWGALVFIFKKFDSARESELAEEKQRCREQSERIQELDLKNTELLATISLLKLENAELKHEIALLRGQIELMTPKDEPEGDDGFQA